MDLYQLNEENKMINLDDDYYYNLLDDDYWPEPSIFQYEDCLSDEQGLIEDNPWIWLDCMNINGNKLESFLTDTNQHKRFDKTFSHPDVIKKFVYYDYIHDFCERKGARNAFNHIERLIEKCAKSGTLVSTIRSKIINNPKYKKCHTFKSCAKLYLDSLDKPYSSEWNYMLDQYVHHENKIWTKSSFLNTYGYRIWDTCHCGKYHD